MENLPEVPAELIERLDRYQNTRGATFSGWLEDGSLLVTTRFGETSQVHRVAMPMGMREQLTFYREPVSAVTAAPAAGADGFVFGKDVGGSEFWQLHWYDLDSREVSLLTDGGRSQNTAPLWSHDGRWLAWSSTARNGTDYDLWLRDMAGGEARIVLQQGGMWLPMDFSPESGRLLVMKYVSINESYPGELDLATGELRMFPVDGGKAAFRAFRYAPDGRSVYYVSDEGREFLTLFQHDPRGGAPTALSAHVPWDVRELAIAADGRHLAYVSNEDGISRLRVLSLPDHRELDLPELPIGVIGSLGFSPDGRRLALTLNSATSPSDVYVLDLAQGKLARWTQSEVGGLDASRFRAPELVRFPTFDEVEGQPRTIPAFYYRPEGEGPFPVVISIHGGPESQALPVFNPNTQFLLNELKVAVLVPNVRGSAGYGKTYLQLDNGLKREDSVRDIGALLEWIATRPELDATRVGVMGGSYGGYMVLASMVHYDDRLRAGIDVVGISHFRTFLENTESYRRDLRRAEYGDERIPEIAAFHERIAPLNNAHRITRPLFVAQGYNDPRVPWTEAEQIVKAVRGNGGEVWYLMFRDEGHGFRKKSNSDFFNAAAMLFWQKHLLGK
ncbi:prolyl oligopeptidase family serine peptidase [Arenimonas fontis]|uniref:Prolyl oligopeptidase family serine peptidase n=2 Tax=Arenimonas fontis TaxID=2608255 RepID=A0A5B2Z9S3_9GAMM|nr:prolyl oligopeptidase family serine peptidase [Arenimonas fontis]